MPLRMSALFLNIEVFSIASLLQSKRKRCCLLRSFQIILRQHLWRRVRDSNPRFLSESPVFKTGSLNRSDNSPFDEMISFRHEIVKVFPVLAIQSFEWSALDGTFPSLWCFSKLLGGYAVCREKQSALRIKVSYSHIAIAPSLDVAQNFVIWYSVSSLQRITAEAL